MNNPYLLRGLVLSVETFRALADLIDGHRWDTSESDRFTPREVLAHLADWEPIFRDRIERAMAEPAARIEAYDEGQMALDHGYASWDPSTSLEAFAEEREKTVSTLSRLTASDFGRTFQHPELGPMTIADQASMLLGHDAYHAEQMASYARLSVLSKLGQ